MPITLNHTIVPSRDKDGSAQFFARIFGLSGVEPNPPFAQVHVNADLSFDWGTSDGFESHHYAFVVTDQEFDEIFGRLQGENVRYGSGPNAPRQRRDQHAPRRPRPVLRGSRRPPHGDHDHPRVKI